MTTDPALFLAHGAGCLLASCRAERDELRGQVRRLQAEKIDLMRALETEQARREVAQAEIRRLIESQKPSPM